MPKIGKKTIRANVAGRSFVENIEVHVNADGRFYTKVPENLLTFFQEEDIFPRKNGGYNLFANTMEKLLATLEKALYAVNNPEIKVEHIIKYNIQTKAPFIENENGDIFPNGCYLKEGEKGKASWNNDKYRYHEMPGLTHKEGYFLSIAAQALTKTTKKYGDGIERVEYELYYKNGDHFGNENPAEKLNSWTDMSVDKNAKEIPYSDEAALFFHNLIYNMTKMVKKIQDYTADQEKLLQIIEQLPDTKKIL